MYSDLKKKNHQSNSAVIQSRIQCHCTKTSTEQRIKNATMHESCKYKYVLMVIKSKCKEHWTLSGIVKFTSEVKKVFQVPC